ncbi:hypothetical protein JCM15519_17290 [Fundidesulfovibrio butyratiphilus]
MATIKQCDRCGSVERVSTISVAAGRRRDAGGSSDDVVVAQDLCEACQTTKFWELCKEHLVGVEKVLRWVNHG